MSVDQWVGKLAVISGASVGIGAAMAKKLVQSGINVVGLARRVEKVQALAEELKNQKGKLYAVKCDITNENDVVKAIEEINKIGPIHILINNAGMIAQTTLYNGDVEAWRKVLETNIIGTCLLQREAIKIMTDRQIAGQIVNINSVLGHFIYPIPRSNLYPASKHALGVLTETLRQELVGLESRIKVTSLSPGPVNDTEFFDKNNIGVTLKNYLTPEDIVNALMYVLSTPPHMHVAELLIRPVGEIM